MTSKEIFLFLLGGVLVWFWLADRRSPQPSVTITTPEPSPAPSAPTCGGSA